MYTVHDTCISLVEQLCGWASGLATLLGAGRRAKQFLMVCVAMLVCVVACNCLLMQFVVDFRNTWACQVM